MGCITLRNKAKEGQKEVVRIKFINNEFNFKQFIITFT